MSGKKKGKYFVRMTDDKEADVFDSAFKSFDECVTFLRDLTHDNDITWADGEPAKIYKEVGEVMCEHKMKVKRYE